MFKYVFDNCFYTPFIFFDIVVLYHKDKYMSSNILKKSVIKIKGKSKKREKL